MITSYKDLPIGKYLQILAVTETEPDEARRNPAILSILDGRPVEVLEDLPLMEFAGLMHRAGFLVEPPKPEKARKSYVCGQFELVPVLDFKKITTAQYIDFQTFAAAKGDAPRVVEILSCLLVPKGSRYCDGYDAPEVQAAIRENMSTADAASLYSFFIERLLHLMRPLATFSKRMARRLPRERRVEILTELKTLTSPETLEAVGDGLRMLTPFQRLSETLGTPSGR